MTEKFINADGEVFEAKDSADAGALRRAGVTEATEAQAKADVIQKQYSATWKEHPILEAFNTLEAGALGVAKAIPGLTTAARGYTQAYDALTGQYGAPGSVTQNFEDYMKAEAGNHKYMDTLGQVGGMVAAGSAPGSIAAEAFGAGLSNSAVSVAATGAAQGFGYALDKAATDHLLAPDGAEKAGALTAQLAIGAVLGGATSAASNAAMSKAVAFLDRGGLYEVGQAVQAKGAELLSKEASNAVTQGAEKIIAGSGKAAMGLGALHIHGAAAIPAAVAGAAKAVKAVANPQNAGKVVAGLGRAIDGFDEGIGKVLSSNLLNKLDVPIEGAVTGVATGLVTKEAYDQVSQRLAALGNRPADLVPTLAMVHAEAGTDPQVADVAVQQQARAIAYLSEQRPKPAFGAADSVAPVQQTASLREKAEFIDRVNAVQNPTWALQNPNPARMEAVLAVYPVLHNAVTALVSQHAATMPQLSLAQRQWAAQVTGRPATPMSSPRIQAILALQSQLEQQKKQVPKVGMGGASDGDTMVDSTQAERLGD